MKRITKFPYMKITPDGAVSRGFQTMTSVHTMTNKIKIRQKLSKNLVTHLKKYPLSEKQEIVCLISCFILSLVYRLLS